MPKMNINGETHQLEESQKLLPYLRDTLKLTSVKDGCSEGACGTCMVLVDGKPEKACVLKAARLDGKSIVTVEGFSKREKEVYSYAFTHVGAVQCGFCTPGMLISAKGLIDQNPSPTRQDVKGAIKNNICRCTGYKKIEDAILLAAEYFRDGKIIEESSFTGRAGESMHRVDAGEKALGTAVYTDDIHMDGMLYGAAKRSGYPRARLLNVRTEKAKALEGVEAVLTAADIPGTIKIGHVKKDWDVMIPVGEITRYLGDAVALVAARDRETLKAALELIEVEYEELPGIFSPAEGMKEGAPLIHEGVENNILFEQELVRGDADEVIKNSKYVVSNHYSVPFTEHAFLEPECAVAYLDEDMLRIISADQGIYQTQKECADMLRLPYEKVRVTAAMVGGGFGGKEDMSVQHHAALLSYHTKKPVKVKLTRQESILVHPKRHAMEMDFTAACDENGTLTAMKAVICSDTGAYASLGASVLQRACTHAAGPYTYKAVDIRGRAVYTNNPPAGAFRGFGVTQSCFATECNLNKLAELVGISPFEIRYKNAIRPGEVLANGQIADESTGLVETLDALREDFLRNPKAGIACAMKNSGIGVGIPDTGRSRIEIKGGKAHLHSSAACIGQGMGTIQVQMLCEETGLTPKDVVYDTPDTLFAPNSGNTTASRQTLFTGEAVVRAAKKLKAALDEAGTLEALEGQSFHGEYQGMTDKMGSDKENPVSHIAYGYATHLVELDEEGLIKRVVAAHDVGRAMNPVLIEGQIEGGVVMSLGYSLTEDFPLDHGKPKAKFGTLGLFKADKTPEVVSKIIEKNKGGFAHGAKGIGEICSIPTPPAVQLAYYQYDGNFRTQLPLEGTPYSKKKK
ncbi:selenium-dependent xanthine dehydrogenase [Christensenellaceae bacterium OttesenSCG-928-M15]|nr:selenium-dependent xanthine dehydrogenase [Christensenellaceae bacterium OttesenSCG-928-M15]